MEIGVYTTPKPATSLLDAGQEAFLRYTHPLHPTPTATNKNTERKIPHDRNRT